MYHNPVPRTSHIPYIPIHSVLGTLCWCTHLCYGVWGLFSEQTEHVVVTVYYNLLYAFLFGVFSCAGPTNDSCYDEVTTMTPSATTTSSSSTTTTSSTGSATGAPTQLTAKPPATTLSVMPSPTSTPTAEPPTKVVRVRVTPGVQNNSPTLTVVWQALAGGSVNYTVKYSTQPGEVNTPPEGALEVRGISGTSTILTALERGTTYYIWVVGVSEGGEGPHSDRMSGVTYDSELNSRYPKPHTCCAMFTFSLW